MRRATAGRRPDAHRDADRAGAGSREGSGARCRRRRLCHQAFRGIRWYPDSRSVLLEVWTSGGKRFRQIDVETGESQTIFEGPAAGSIWSQAELSRDGKTLFYSIYGGSSPEAKLRLMRRDLDTGQETELYRRADSPSLGFTSLTLSPDGNRLAFLDPVSAEQRALLTAPVNGGAVTEIHRGSGSSSTRPGFFGASWTKDGRYLIAVGYLDGKNLPGACQLLAFLRRRRRAAGAGRHHANDLKSIGFARRAPHPVYQRAAEA
jgi:Tol biopolymer transport system component